MALNKVLLSLGPVCFHNFTKRFMLEMPSKETCVLHAFTACLLNINVCVYITSLKVIVWVRGSNGEHPCNGNSVLSVR